jgi:outer membrane immunogenic protein
VKLSCSSEPAASAPKLAVNLRKSKMKLKYSSAFVVPSIAAFLLAGAAQAADAIPARRGPPPPLPVKIKDWSGAYIGVHGGASGNGFDSKSTPNIPALNFGNTPNVVGAKNKNKGKSTNGGKIGAQAGYNFQSGNIVYGVEAATSFTGNSKKKSTTGLTAQQSNISTLKAKLGYSFGKTLVYGTAGLAVAPTKYTSPANGAFAASSKSVTKVGAVAGVGVEHMLTDSLSLKGEVDYAHFGKSNVKFAAGTSKIESGQVSATVGLNYRF